MTQTENILTVAHVNEHGQMTLPEEYLRDHSPTPDSAFLLLQIGDSLILMPEETALNELSELVQEVMRRRDVGVNDLIAATIAARAEIVQREFGDLIESAP
jgi:hypothetical protein